MPTWMAGNAKFVAIYEHAFWRDAGLSGEGRSRVGPLVEIHDACDEHGLAALTAFIGTPPQARLGALDHLRDAAIAQLVRLFGDAAQHPVRFADERLGVGRAREVSGDGEHRAPGFPAEIFITRSSSPRTGKARFPSLASLASRSDARILMTAGAGCRPSRAICPVIVASTTPSMTIKGWNHAISTSFP